jgi:hypothetical protein
VYIIAKFLVLPLGGLATWNLGTNPAFALEPRKTTENIDLVQRWRTRGPDAALGLIYSGPRQVLGLFSKILTSQL